MRGIFSSLCSCCSVSASFFLNSENWSPDMTTFFFSSFPFVKISSMRGLRTFFIDWEEMIISTLQSICFICVSLGLELMVSFPLADSCCSWSDRCLKVKRLILVWSEVFGYVPSLNRLLERFYNWLFEILVILEKPTKVCLVFLW